MFHCEPQYSEILPAALMVTADVFKTQSYGKHLNSCLAFQCHQRALWHHQSWAGDPYDGHPWAWLGDGFVFVLAAEFLVALQISQEM